MLHPKQSRVGHFLWLALSQAMFQGCEEGGASLVCYPWVSICALHSVPCARKGTGTSCLGPEAAGQRLGLRKFCLALVTASLLPTLCLLYVSISVQEQLPYCEEGSVNKWEPIRMLVHPQILPCWRPPENSILGSREPWKGRKNEASRSPHGLTIVLTESNPVILRGYGFDFAVRKEEVICRFHFYDMDNSFEGKWSHFSWSRLPAFIDCPAGSRKCVEANRALAETPGRSPPSSVLYQHSFNPISYQKNTCFYSLFFILHSSNLRHFCYGTTFQFIPNFLLFPILL